MEAIPEEYRPLFEKLLNERCEQMAKAEYKRVYYEVKNSQSYKDKKKEYNKKYYQKKKEYIESKQ